MSADNSPMYEIHACYGQYMAPGMPWTDSEGGCSQACEHRHGCYRETNKLPPVQPRLPTEKGIRAEIEALHTTMQELAAATLEKQLLYVKALDALQRTLDKGEYREATK